MKHILPSCLAILGCFQVSIQADECCFAGDSCGFTLGGEFLWWTAYQTNLDYVVDEAVILPNGENTPILKDAHTKFLTYDWEPGFRIYGAFRTCHDCWTVKASWTYFHQNASAKTEVCGDDRRLHATLVHPDMGPEFATNAYGKHDLDYDLIDVTLTRPFFVCDTLVLNPYFGVRTIFLDQKLHINYLGDEFEGSVSIYQSSCPEEIKGTIVDWKSCAYGVGIHGGLDTTMDVGCGFGLYGRFGGGLVAGQNDQSHRQLSELNSSEPIVCVKEKQNLVMPMLQFESGLNWETDCMGYATLSLRAGYTLTYLWNVPQMRRYHDDNEAVSNSATSGSLGLHGGIFSAEISF